MALRRLLTLVVLGVLCSGVWAIVVFSALNSSALASLQAPSLPAARVALASSDSAQAPPSPSLLVVQVIATPASPFTPTAPSPDLDVPLLATSPTAAPSPATATPTATLTELPTATPIPIAEGTVAASPTATTTEENTVAASPSLTPTPIPTATAATPEPTPRPPFPVLPSPATEVTGIGTYTVQFDQLTGGAPLTLQGVNPSATVYWSIPEDWSLSSGRLEIHLLHSAALLPESTLTVKVNNVPIASTHLTADNVTETVWNIDVPSDALTGDALAITFAGYLRTSDDPCHDLEEVANWAIVQQNSVLTVGMQRLPFQANLGLFPYPFFRARSLRSQSALVVLPDAAPGEDIAAILPTAGYLGQLAGWQNFSAYAVRERDLTDSLKSNYDLIFAGRPDQLRVIREQTWPLKLNPEGRFVDPAGSTLADDTGVIMESASPWSSARGVLLLTGTTSEALRRAVQAVIQPSFPNLARGDFALVPQAPSPAPVSSVTDRNTLTLETLGYKDQTVQGIGRHTTDINFDLFSNRTVRDAQLTVYLSHSPFVSTDRSYLNVMFNNVPIKGVYLSSENEEHGALQVTLPGRQFRPGRNTLQFLFELHLAQQEDCTRLLLEQAWGVVHRDSLLSIRFEEAPPNVDLSTLPSPFGEASMMVIPGAPGSNELAGAFLLMTQFGHELGDRVRNITVVSDNLIDRNALKNQHAILLGRKENNSLLAEALPQAPYRLDGTIETLSSPGLSLKVQAGQAVGVLQEMPSPWNAARTTMIVTGSQDEGVGWASLLITEPARRGQLKGNVAVIDSSGTLTTLDTRVPPTPVSGSIPGTRPTPDWALPLLIVAVAVLVILLALLILRRAWRRQANNP